MNNDDVAVANNEGLVDQDGDLEAIYKRIIHPKKKLFLDRYLEFGTQIATAEACGIGRWIVWKWRRDDPDFGAICGALEESYTQILETEAYKRALDEKMPMSSVLLMFLLKAKRPEVYRDNISMEHKIIGEIRFISHLPEPDYIEGKATELLEEGKDATEQSQG